jgi:hypothetical protein
MTPVNAVWFVVFFSICLNCIAIGSTQTATAIFNITAPALDISYIAVILAHQIWKKKIRFVHGPVTLGKWGTPINYIAIVWVFFISVVLFFPPHKPVTPANMYAPLTLLYPTLLDWEIADRVFRNYAVCVAAFIGLFSMSWWWISARRYASHPLSTSRHREIETNVPPLNVFRVYTGPRTKDLLQVIDSEDPDFLAPPPDLFDVSPEPVFEC